MMSVPLIAFVLIMIFHPGIYLPFLNVAGFNLMNPEGKGFSPFRTDNNINIPEGSRSNLLPIIMVEPFHPGPEFIDMVYQVRGIIVEKSLDVKCISFKVNPFRFPSELLIGRGSRD